MATWGVHFRIAENILNIYPKINRKFFAIGNIAPDCGLPNKDWSAFTPPKEISHFSAEEISDFLFIKTNKFILNDVKFYSTYLREHNLISFQKDRSILFGYFIHLITDNLWNYYIMKPLKEKYLDILQKNPNFIWDIKRDWYDLDKIFITENKDSLFWTDFLEAEYNDDLLDFFPREGVKRQLKFIKKFYQISNEEYMRISKKEFIYLDRKQMDNFIQNSTNVILDILAKIFEKDFSFTDKISVLDGILIWH
ncbi:MAG: zinc dependent phospholipase C family protein [Candidatus Lokiarchaeota archaeon]|nr:zinc dependent phospholipase C family protein [Candidatus Lokiarchaeota archaeon]